MDRDVPWVGLSQYCLNDGTGRCKTHNKKVWTPGKEVEVFEDSKCGCRTWLVRSRWKPTNAQQLAGIGFCGLTPAEAETDSVNPITMQNDELVLCDRPWLATPFADRVTQLHIQTQVLQSSAFKIATTPFLSYG